MNHLLTLYRTNGTITQGGFHEALLLFFSRIFLNKLPSIARWLKALFQRAFSIRPVFLFLNLMKVQGIVSGYGAARFGGVEQ